jgi:hypothetical protein
MIKTFDNITVRSNHSDNWYDTFRVDTDRNIVSFVQRDARRNGQVARRMTITVLNDDTYIIEALSAEGGRYESFNSTQCLKLALSLLEEAHSEARQVSNVKDVKPAKPYEDMGIVVGVSFIILTLLPIVCTITLSNDEYLTVLRTCAILIGAFLSIYFLVETYNYRKEYESKE